MKHQPSTTHVIESVYWPQTKLLIIIKTTWWPFSSWCSLLRKRLVQLEIRGRHRATVQVWVLHMRSSLMTAAKISLLFVWSELLMWPPPPENVDVCSHSAVTVNHINRCDGFCIDCVIMFFSSRALMCSLLFSGCNSVAVGGRVGVGGCNAELCVCCLAVSSTMLIESGERSRLHMSGWNGRLNRWK